MNVMLDVMFIVNAHLKLYHNSECKRVSSHLNFTFGTINGKGKGEPLSTNG